MRTLTSFAWRIGGVVGLLTMAGCTYPTPAADSPEYQCPGYLPIAEKRVQTPLPLGVGYIAEQLSTDVTAHVFGAPSFTVKVVPGSNPAAHADIASSEIVLTDAALREGWSADELYAVLAHEVFHLVRAQARQQRCLSYAEQRSEELAADKEAVWLMRRVGRDAGALARVLLRYPDAPPDSVSQATHPPLDARIAEIEAARLAPVTP